MSAQVLSQLRDIHLPPQPDLWPPMPAFWVLLGGVIGVWLFLLWRRRLSTSLRFRVRRELTAIRRRYARHPDPTSLVAHLGTLLRRAAISVDGDVAAGLAGCAWAEYLRRSAPPGCSAQTWDIIALHRYEPCPASIEARILLADCRRWLERVVR